MWKKWSILFVAAMMILAGCSGQASLVRDSLVNSMEKPNFDYEGNLKLTGDVDKLLELTGSKDDVELKALLEAFKSGITVEGSQTDLNHAKLVMKANDDKLLREKGLWTGEDKAAVELLIDKNAVYAKTPLDSNYLKLDPTEQMNALPGRSDPAKVAELQEKLNKLTLDFTKKYISKFAYKLSQVKDLGKETITLPNGEKAETTHVAITLDLKDLVSMAHYIVNDAATNKDVKDFAIDFMTFTTMMTDQSTNQGKKLTEAEYRAQAAVMVEMGLKQLKQWLDTEGKNYTPDKIVEMAKQEGLEAVTLTLDYYINGEKLPVLQKSTLDITVKDKADKKKEPVTFGFASDSYAWNFGKATEIAFPKADQSVTVEQLKKDKESIKAFNEKGFFHHFVKEMANEPNLESVQKGQ